MQPSALTLATTGKIGLPVSAVPGSGESPQRHWAGQGKKRGKKTLRNHTHNLLALRSQCWPACSEDVIMGRVQTKRHTVRGLFISCTQRVQTICYPSVDSRTTAALSHFYQRDHVRCPPRKKKKYLKEKKNPICSTKLWRRCGGRLKKMSVTLWLVRPKIRIGIFV